MAIAAGQHGAAAGATWILVANLSRARVFVFNGSDERLVEVACFMNAARGPGREETRERPPRTHESANPARHAIEPHTTLRAKRQRSFAGILGDALKDACSARRFEHLILVAPAQFLGALREELPESVRNHVSGELRNDLTTLPEREIFARLRLRPDR